MSGPGPAGSRDPGLARARTSLAWTRTSLAFAAIGGIILKRDLIAGLVILALSALVWAVGRLAVLPDRVSARPGSLLVIAVAVTGISVTVLALVLFGPQTPGLRF